MTTFVFPSNIASKLAMFLNYYTVAFKLNCMKCVINILTYFDSNNSQFFSGAKFSRNKKVLTVFNKIFP